MYKKILKKNYVVTYKTTSFTQFLSYSNQKGYLYFKTKIGVAGSMFEPHPPNLQLLRCSNDVEMIFGLSLLVSNFQRSVWECSIHSCSCPWIN